MSLPIVALSGWGMASVAWDALAAAMPGAVRVAIDLTDVLQGADDTADAALEAVSRAAPPRCVALGWSLGAQLALQWALRRPEQVARLALVAATPRFVCAGDGFPGMAPDVFDAFAASFEADPAQALRRFALLQARGERDPLAAGRALRAAVCAPTAANLPRLQAGLRLLRTTDLRSAVHRLRQPVQLVHGAHDALVPLAAAQALQQRLPDARLRVVDDAGHAPHVSHAAAVAAALAEFVHER